MAPFYRLALPAAGSTGSGSPLGSSSGGVGWVSMAQAIRQASGILVAVMPSNWATCSPCWIVTDQSPPDSLALNFGLIWASTWTTSNRRGLLLYYLSQGHGLPSNRGHGQ